MNYKEKAIINARGEKWV